MASPEEIAREAAEALVRVEDGGAENYHLPFALMIGRYQGRHLRDGSVAGREADAIRAEVAAAVLAAVERALREVPVPGGLDAERLGWVESEMKSSVKAYEGCEIPPWLQTLRDLLADNAHLRRALHDCGQDGTARVWAAGYEAGREAMMGVSMIARVERLEEALREIAELGDVSCDEGPTIARTALGE